MRNSLGRLLSICEAEPDFWPNARHLFRAGEQELAFEGLYMYLLRRDDLWKEHHALIKSLIRSAGKSIDFDALDQEETYGAGFSDFEFAEAWREMVVASFEQQSEEADGPAS